MLILAVVGLAIVEILLLLAYLRIRRAESTGPRWWLHEVLLGWQVLYWIGALALLASSPGDATTAFVTIVSLAQVSFTAGCLLAVARPLVVPTAAEVLTKPERRVAIVVGVIAGAVCLAFVVAVVRNQALGPILAGVVTGDQSFLSYRLIMSTGAAAYFAPGYVKQFRDVLLLGALLVLVLKNRRPPWLLITLGSAIGFAAAVLSGERSVLMIFLYTMGLAALLRPGRSIHLRRSAAVVTGMVALAAFVTATYLLGRTTVDASPVRVVGESLWGLVDRVVLTVPRENADGFGVWSTVAPTWGRSWASDLIGILPGAQASLSNDLHEFLGGGPLGNSVLGLAADVYLAWGVVGVAAVPFAFAVSLASLDRVLLLSRSALTRTFRLTILPLTFAWYSPFLFVLNGGVVLLGVVAATQIRKRVD